MFPLRTLQNLRALSIEEVRMFPVYLFLWLAVLCFLLASFGFSFTTFYSRRWSWHDTGLACAVLAVIFFLISLETP